MENLILVLSLDTFDTDLAEKTFSNKVLTRQEISDKIYEITTYEKPNEVFSSYFARLLTLDEFVIALNADDLNIDNSWVLKVQVK